MLRVSGKVGLGVSSVSGKRRWKGWEQLISQWESVFGSRHVSFPLLTSGWTLEAGKQGIPLITEAFCPCLGKGSDFSLYQSVFSTTDQTIDHILCGTRVSQRGQHTWVAFAVRIISKGSKVNHAILARRSWHQWVSHLKWCLGIRRLLIVLLLLLAPLAISPTPRNMGILEGQTGNVPLFCIYSLPSSGFNLTSRCLRSNILC